MINELCYAAGTRSAEEIRVGAATSTARGTGMLPNFPFSLPNVLIISFFCLNFWMIDELCFAGATRYAEDETVAGSSGTSPNSCCCLGGTSTATTGTSLLWLSESRFFLPKFANSAGV